MNSAEDVEPPVAGGHDERLVRAFDRVARLGIDLEDDDLLSDREAAAVRAFTALRHDDDTDETPSPGASRPPFDGPVAEPVPSGPDDEGPLRPDAVLRNRRFTPRDDRYAPESGGSGGVEVDLPPPPAGADPGQPPSGSGTAPRQDATSPGSATGPTGEATDTAAADAAAFDPPERTGDGYVLDVAAFGVASGAFVWPWAWPAALVVVLVVGAVACSMANGRSPSALLGRGVRHVLSWLRPRSLLVGVAVVARITLLALVLPALVCAGWWIITEGVDGAFVAARIGVWTHGWRVGAAAVCFTLVVGGSEARSRRSVLVRKVTGQLGTTAVMVLAAGLVVVALAIAIAAPRAGAGWSTGDDGLGWAPVRLQDNIDRMRDDLVSAEVHAATGCLSDHQGVTWRATYTTGNPLREDDVVRLSAARMEDPAAPSASQLATAAAALHNQLAPWVEGIELDVDGDTVVVLDRTDLPGGRPLVDPGLLAATAGTGAHRLVDGADGFDRAVALSCSAAPLP